MYLTIQTLRKQKQKNNLDNLDRSGELKDIGKYEAKESDMLLITKGQEYKYKFGRYKNSFSEALQGL